MPKDKQPKPKKPSQNDRLAKVREYINQLTLEMCRGNLDDVSKRLLLKRIGERIDSLMTDDKA